MLPVQPGIPKAQQIHLLAGLATFIKAQHLRDYQLESLYLARQLEVPLLKHLSHLSDEEIIALGTPGVHEFFDAIINDEVEDYIERSNQRWLDNQLPLIAKDAVVADDPALINHVRKQVLLKYIRLYTDNVDQRFELIREIDLLLLRINTAAHQTYIAILRSRIDEQLHFNEKITHTVPGAIYVYDLREQRNIYNNNKLAEMLGYDTGELQAMGDQTMTLLLHPSDLPRALGRRETLQSLQPGDLSYWEYQIRDQSGTYRWMRSYEAVFKQDADGQVRQVIGIALDIDHSKRTETALQLREAELREVQATAGLGSYEWTIGTRDIKASPEFWKIFEVSNMSEEIDLRSRIHPDDLQRVSEAISASASTGSPFDCEYRIRTEHGEKVVWSRGVLVEKDEQKILKGSLLDVTERNRLLEQLRQSEQLYRQAQAMSHIGSWKWEFADNSQEWSDEMYRIYGSSREAAPDLQELPMLRNHPDDRELIELKVQEARQEQRPTEFYYRILLEDGTQKQVHAHCELGFDAEGQPARLYGTLQDVTDILETERKLDALNQQLARSNEYLQEFAYVASHDLKEPLRKVSTFGKMLLEGERATISERGLGFLERMVTATERMQQMIDDLLSLSQINTRGHFEPVSLQAILEETLQALEHKIESIGARIQSAPLPQLIAVPAQLRQLFLNLIANSIKFAHEGRPLLVKIQCQPLQRTEKKALGLPEERPYLRLVFQDNGIGFENQYAEKIFQIFQRLHGKSEYEGNGIGLAVCRKIVEHHGGLIQASGEKDVGARFQIILPLQ